MFAQVIVDIVHENVAGSAAHPRTFSYRVPPDMKLSVGQRVEVPFGRLIKEGVVLGFSEDCDVPPEKLKSGIAACRRRVRLTVILLSAELWS